MKKILWQQEEAVALFDLYFRYNGNLNAIPSNEITRLSDCYHKRAILLGLDIDDKFRNYHGISKQLACIHYVVTNGKGGFSSASRLFYNTYNLYLTDLNKFNSILLSFYEKYK